MEIDDRAIQTSQENAQSSSIWERAGKWIADKVSTPVVQAATGISKAEAIPVPTKQSPWGGGFTSIGAMTDVVSKPMNEQKDYLANSRGIGTKALLDWGNEKKALDAKYGKGWNEKTSYQWGGKADKYYGQPEVKAIPSSGYDQYGRDKVTGQIGTNPYRANTKSNYIQDSMNALSSPAKGVISNTNSRPIMMGGVQVGTAYNNIASAATPADLSKVTAHNYDQNRRSIPAGNPINYVPDTAGRRRIPAANYNPQIVTATRPLVQQITGAKDSKTKLTPEQIRTVSDFSYTPGWGSFIDKISKGVM